MRKAIPLLALLALVVVPVDARTLIEWDFSSDASGWFVSSGVQNLKARDGCLTGRTVARDPSISGPLFEIEASPYQYVEIRMRSSKGSGELFWTNTTEPPYSGFRSQMCKRIEYVGGDFHVYRVFPAWQSAEKIIRLRLDPPEDSEFEVDYIRVVEIDASRSDRSVFDFTQADQLWLSADDPQPSASTDGIEVRSEGYLVSPRLDLDAKDFGWLTIMSKSEGPENLIIEWITDELPGARAFTLTLKPDNAWHTYNIPTDGIPDWFGRLRMLAVRTQSNGGSLHIRSVGASSEPQGPAEIEIRRFGSREAINRTGSIAEVEAVIANVGGQSAVNIELALHIPRPGIGALVSGTGATGQVVDGMVRSIPELKPGGRQEFSWQVRAIGVGECPARLTVSGSGLPPLTAETKLTWHPAVSVSEVSYVPEPKPVRGATEVGVYYYPGWPAYAKWSVLDKFPERRPVLGYYREGNSEVADWHIKWMVEHGITFIVYDWYWSAGNRYLEHALHDGFFQARYRDKIKFCLLWANHNAPNTSSPEDMVELTNYWLDNYFLRPEYFKVDGKPLVVIFQPSRLSDDMGIEGVRQALEKSRGMAKARGLEGIYFAACTYPGGHLKDFELQGYDALTGYNYPSAGDKGRNRAPYEDMVAAFPETWTAIADNSSLPYIPVAEAGWDSRPWHGPNARVRTGKTPALFKTMLEHARDFTEKRGPRILLIEAWNEFGEGDYIEPHREFGFGFLDAVRDVFTSASKEHDDIVPQDVGLGPYELTRPLPVTSWEFSDPANPGWDASQGLGGARVEGGCLNALSTSHDPAFYSNATAMDSARFGVLEIRMKVDQGSTAQMFWSGGTRGFTEAASARFDLRPGDEFQTYTLDLHSQPAWKSKISALRFDPTDRNDARMSIDYIRFLKRP